MMATWPTTVPVPPLRERIITTLQVCGWSTRDELVSATGIPRTTIYDALKRLIQQGIVDYQDAVGPFQGRGRPARYFYIVEANA